MAKSVVVIYRLACDHLVYGAPNNTKKWCPFCMSAERTADIEVTEWHVKCRQCPFARWAGMSEPNAREIKNRHEQAHPSHRVTVESKANPAAVKVRDAMTKNEAFK